MTPPVFAGDDLQPRAVDLAFREHGGFFVRDASARRLLGSMLEAGRAFFSLPCEQKAALAIERSPHHRGWSQMRNERDWREQLHLGRERRSAGDQPPYRRLEGPNLWPADAEWRARVSSYVDAVTRLGEVILRNVARALDADGAPFEGVGDDGYVVAKLIAYHPQPSPLALRSGVAAHVDFSWLTVNLQDSEGLEVRRPDGVWEPVAAQPDRVWVHAGELLQHATRGRYRATPHRVLNRSSTRTRLSMPVFVNPPLDACVPVLSKGPAGPAPGDDAGEHIHRVLDPGAPAAALHFGQAEWTRKGRGRWCFACSPA